MACISGAVGALIVAFFDARNYVYAGLPGLLTTVNAISSENPKSFPGMLIGCAVAAVGAVILVQILGFDDPVDETTSEGYLAGAAAASEDTAAASSNAPKAEEAMIYAPMNGTVKALEGCTRSGIFIGRNGTGNSDHSE